MTKSLQYLDKNLLPHNTFTIDIAFQASFFEFFVGIIIPTIHTKLNKQHDVASLILETNTLLLYVNHLTPKQ